MNKVLATSTLPLSVSFLRHHCLARFSILVILSLKFSSAYFFKSSPILTPSEVTHSVHFIPHGLCLKFEEAAIQIASLLSRFRFKPEQTANLSIKLKANWSEFSSAKYKHVSSANWDILYSFMPSNNPSILGFCRMACAKISTIDTKRFAEIGQPCLIPRVGLKNYSRARC